MSDLPSELPSMRCPWGGGPTPATPPCLPVSIFVQCRGQGPTTPQLPAPERSLTGKLTGASFPHSVPLRATPLSHLRRYSLIVTLGFLQAVS